MTQLGHVPVFLVWLASFEKIGGICKVGDILDQYVPKIKFSDHQLV
jgi:hypothetical protein